MKLLLFYVQRLNTIVNNKDLKIFIDTIANNTLKITYEYVQYSITKNKKYNSIFDENWRFGYYSSKKIQILFKFEKEDININSDSVTSNEYMYKNTLVFDLLRTTASPNIRHINNDDGKILMQNEEIMNRYMKYFLKLLNETHVMMKVRQT